MKIFGHRSIHETKLLEILPVIQSIRFIRHRLKHWIKPKKRKIIIGFKSEKAQIIPQPLGVVGIVVPWNYPILCSLIPLVSALAAGNRIMIYMPKETPRLGALMKHLLGEVFQMQIVQIINADGDSEITQSFVQLPFDHLFFTGSTAIEPNLIADNNHLSPTTIESSGKSLAIITPEYPLKNAVKRILIGKLLNAGQTSAAPDYVFIPHKKADKFIQYAKKLVHKVYPDFLNNSDYTSIINKQNFTRLQSLCEDAKNKGATIIPLTDQPSDEKQRKFTPCLIVNVNDNMRIMNEEIFGPILPIITYEDMAETIDYINQRPSPLALYLFDKKFSSH